MCIRSVLPIGAILRQLVFLFALAIFGTAESRAQALLGPEQIDALTAPIALYPDTLLAQVLIASTYPSEVAEAAQWQQQNSGLQGAALDSALEQRQWDPSVMALVQVPTVLQQMNSRLDWTQQLGDAFLAQQGDVMDSVQRLRQRAQAAGNLMTTDQQVVETMGQTIVIQQANPQVIFVPSYNPTVVFGGWPYPAFPPVFWPTPPGYAFARGIAWGAGVAIGASVWNRSVWDNRFDWGGRNINVNVNAPTSPTSTTSTSTTSPTTVAPGSTTPQTGVARTIATPPHASGSVGPTRQRSMRGANRGASTKKA